MRFHRLDPSGALTEFDYVDWRSIRDAVGGTLDFVRLTVVAGAFVHDESMYERLPLNVIGSLLAGRHLYGPMVLTAAEPDGDGESIPLSGETLMWVTAMAERWNMVVMNATIEGQDPYAYPDPDQITGPMILTGEELDTYMGWKTEGHDDE